jgi:hypothetical protein
VGIRDQVVTGGTIFQTGSFSRRGFIVRDGYTRAIVAGRRVPVEDGLLIVQGRRLPTSFTLVGPAGRRVIPLQRIPGPPPPLRACRVSN